MNKRITYFSLIGFVCLISSFRWLNHGVEKRTVRAIVLEWSMPMIEAKSGSVNILNDSSLIYFTDDLVMFQTPYTYTKFSKIMKKGDTTIILEDQNDFKEKRFKNFIYKKNSSIGLQYDSILVKKNIVFTVDSFLRKKAFKDARFYDKNNDILIDSKRDKKTGLLYEKYIPKVKFDESYNDTTYFVFDPKFKTVSYSLSKEADSLKKMKLIEVKLNYNAKPKTDNNSVEIPKREFIFKIKELKITNQTEIKRLFERFEKDSKMLNLR